MSDREDKKLNLGDELADVKSLIAGAEDGGFSLDDILAEYGVKSPPGRSAIPLRPSPPEDDGPDLPWPEAPRPRRNRDNVVAFPGGGALPPEEDGPAPQDESEPEKGPSEPEGEAPEADAVLDAEENGDKVVEFPEEESPLASFLKDISKKADDYADRMFEESEQMDPEEVRRLETLIPGTDQETEEDLRYVRRPRRQEPPPPDLPPQELARTYGKGLKGLRVRSLLVFLLAAAALVPCLLPSLPVSLPPELAVGYPLLLWISAGLLGAGMLLSLDVLAAGLWRGVRLKVGMDTLAALSCAFTLADTLLLAGSQDRGGQLSYCPAALFGLFFLLHGTYHKRCALRLSCRTAAAAAEPYLVTLDEGKWNGKDTDAKWSGTPAGYGSQSQMDDGAQRIYRVFCPVLLLACIVFSLLASFGIGEGEHLMWCLSATFTAAAGFGGALAYGRSFHKVARRVSQSGGALAGWPGAAGSRRGNRVLITDLDLFPPGFVELNGIKVFGDFSVERVVGYTATLIRDSGCGLEKLFHDLLRTQGAIFRRADSLCCYEGGGLSANIRGDQVLVGSAAFMNLMEVPLPQGLNVKNAVFCAIDGELAGIFALNYTLPDTVFPSLTSLLRERVGPVLATRDFNLIPAMLQQRFKLAADRMDFPPVERRRELSDPEQDHTGVLTAVLCREGLLPFAESVVGARRLRRAVRASAVLTCAGSTLGVLLAYYLTSVDAYASLSPLNLLFYLLMWLLPVWFLSGWVHRY